MTNMVKARNYDEDGFVKRAACICVNDDESQVLLVSSRRDSELWIVPGGGVEPNELPDMAAIREVREEAGVCGMLGRCLGVFENSERGHRTSVYVLEVKEEMEEWDESKVFGRKRKWFSLEEAVEQLAKHKPVQSSYVSLLLPGPDPQSPSSLDPAGDAIIEDRVDSAGDAILEGRVDSAGDAIIEGRVDSAGDPTRGSEAEVKDDGGSEAYGERNDTPSLSREDLTDSCPAGETTANDT